jgi:hypothetical protein
VEIEHRPVEAAGGVDVGGVDREVAERSRHAGRIVLVAMARCR